MGSRDVVGRRDDEYPSLDTGRTGSSGINYPRMRTEGIKERIERGFVWCVRRDPSWVVGDLYLLSWILVLTTSGLAPGP